MLNITNLLKGEFTMKTLLIVIAKNKELTKGVYVTSPGEIFELSESIGAYSNEPDQQMPTPDLNKFVVFVEPLEVPERQIHMMQYKVRKFKILCDVKIAPNNSKKIVDTIRKYGFYNNIGAAILESLGPGKTKNFINKEDLIKFCKNSTGLYKASILRDYVDNDKDKEEIFLEHINDSEGIYIANEVWKIDKDILNKKIEMARKQENQDVLFAIGSCYEDKREEIVKLLSGETAYKAMFNWGLNSSNLGKMLVKGEVSLDSKFKIRLAIDGYVLPKKAAKIILKENKYAIEPEVAIYNWKRLMNLGVFTKEEIRELILSATEPYALLWAISSIDETILSKDDRIKILKSLPVQDIEKFISAHSGWIMEKDVISDILSTIKSINEKVIYDFACENQDKLSKKQKRLILSKINDPFLHKLAIDILM
ncbi:MAG: hypothetical protein QXQ43_04140 [Nitrososphaerota archaeon]